MRFRRLKTLAILALASMASLPVMAQDLLARQAPVDRKMKAVDSVALHRLILNEQAETPAADLYEDWNNHYAHRATALPDTFKINLRGFCMPTENRVVTSNFGARWGRQHKSISRVRCITATLLKRRRNCSNDTTHPIRLLAVGDHPAGSDPLLAFRSFPCSGQWT